jgi:glycosyltransferase involved in cell wall biosynthesis
MRIALVADAKDGLAGGVERHVFELAVAQRARGDSPVVVVPKSGGLAAACEEHDIPVVIAPLRAERPLTDDLCSLFTDIGASIIHSHTYIPNPQVIAAGNRIGIPCVYTHHVQSGFRIPDLEFAMISVCADVFERLKKEGFPEDRLYYIPNGTRVIPRAADASGGPSLISVGRLSPAKGLDVAILAVAELRRRHGPDCPVLNVYGAGVMEEYLQHMASLLGLADTVRFRGIELGILERCPATDVLVLASRVEACPLVVLEAMSRGMPVVATRCAGEIERMMPDQRYGRIVKAGSIAALADGIDSMLADVAAGRFDPDLSISRHRELYSVEEMAERVDAVYQHLLAPRASAVG